MDLVRQGDTIHATFAAAAARWVARPFLHAPADALGEDAPFDLTFGESWAQVEALRQRYLAAGCSRGHRIGLALDNHPCFFLHFLALNGCGASIAPLNGGMRPQELAQILGMADLDLVVAWPRHTALVGEAQALAGIAAPCVAPADPLPHMAAKILAGASAADTEAAMIFTSGTTGTPKGCVLSNDYFTWIGKFYSTLGGYCAFRAEGDRLLTPLPVTHMNALACSFMAAMTTGSCLIQLDRFHASRWWRTVHETGATVIHYLGVMPAILLQAPACPGECEGLRVRFGFGAGVDPRHHQAFETRFGFPLIEAWAMSETGAGGWITANEEPRHVGTRCFGRAPKTMEVRIVDFVGADVPDGTAGELLVRSRGSDPRRHFFSCYYKDPAATEQAWASDWFHTGDVVRRDAAGSLFFVDRDKNIVRRSGENIAAVEVEGVLMQQPAVAACAVLPIADEIRGEEVMALVVPKRDSPDLGLAREIAEFCAGHLAYFKTPGWIAFVEVLPTTDSQKLRRGEIRRLGRELHQAGAAHDLRAAKRASKAPA